MSAALSRLSLFQYGILALPLAFAGLPLYIHAPDFYATHSSIPLAAIGAALFFVRLFDAVQDPIIGWFSNKFSQLRPFIMLFSLLMMGVGFLMLFHPPDGSGLAWFIISLVLATSAFSILSINFNTLGSLWSKEAFQKIRITSWRESCGLVGLLLAAVLPTALGLPVSSILFVLLLFVAGFIFLLWSKANEEVIVQDEAFKTPLNFHFLFSAINRRFFTIYMVSMLASAIPAVLVLFFIRDRLDAEGLTGLFLILYFISGAVGMPLWQKIAKHTNKLSSWLVAMAMAVIAFIWAYFLGEGDVWQYAVICIFSGIAFGAELALPPAILSDMIDRQNDRRKTVLYFSALSFLSKGVLALGSFIAFFILDQFSFVPAAENDASALHSLSITYSLLPCFIKLIAIYLLLRMHKGDIYAQTERTYSHGNHGIS